MPAETEEQSTEAVQEDRPPSSAKSEGKATEAKGSDDKSDAGSLKSEKDGTLAAAEEVDEEREGSQHPGENEEEELSDDASVLKEELDKIRVVTPIVKIDPSELFDPADFPESYNENSPKEKLVLGYSNNFKRQYAHLYRDRKPLFLDPVNECGIEKFVCTTIRPTQLPFKDLYDWDGAAEFVADYLNFTALEPAHEIPKRLLSPTTVLKRQKGNCFEYSVLLCSLLIGAGYDAYVVSGYAARETCLMDETRELCPLLKKKEEVKKEEEAKEMKKYTVRPPKDLRSKFLRKQEARAKKEKELEEEKLRKEEEDRQAELEKPPPDALHGLRVHSWVLVLEGKREVPESFFIEPFTGIAHSLTSQNYLGIESIWNHQNCWVNMQDCREGVKSMQYDLGDCALWEYMFPSNEKPLLQIHEEIDPLDEEEEDTDEIEKHLDMPPSWVMPLKLSPRDFQMRCPHGKKEKLYKRAKLEKFAPYLTKDGLVSRLSVYQDRELLDLTQTKEYYAHRQDKLKERVHNQRTGWITEFYHPGRPRCLREHHYRASAPGPENDRTMIFYNEARVNGLQKREETPIEMTEHFSNREDFLYYRYVEFGKRPKKFGPAEDANPRPIVKMVEKRHRNPNITANDDLAELVFNVAEERIVVTYHTEDDKVSASTREFIKPPNADEKGATIQWHPDGHATYQVNPNDGDKKRVILYQMLVDLLRAEDQCRAKIRESEDEVQDILKDRMKEESMSELEISVYDTERNEKAKKHRQELERLEEEERLRRQEMELDYLAPFLAQLAISDHDKINRQEAFKLKEECLADLKQRLIDKANLIQARFEKETAELQKKQAWYQQNQVSMQKDDEEEYLSYCSEAMFRIHILELRLQRHKEMAPKKYMALENKIRSDQRLSDYLK